MGTKKGLSNIELEKVIGSGQSSIGYFLNATTMMVLSVASGPAVFSLTNSPTTASICAYITNQALPEVFDGSFINLLKKGYEKLIEESADELANGEIGFPDSYELLNDF